MPYQQELTCMLAEGTYEISSNRLGSRSVAGMPVRMAIRALWGIRIRINLRKYRKWGMLETSPGRRMVV
jgi:hypothetical protein